MLGGVSPAQNILRTNLHYLNGSIRLEVCLPFTLVSSPLRHVRSQINLSAVLVSLSRKSPRFRCCLPPMMIKKDANQPAEINLIDRVS